VSDAWQTVLAAPAFVINLDARPDRLEATTEELRRAGFTDVRRFPAVDASRPNELVRAWSACGLPPFAAWDKKFQTMPGKQGCFLSHLALWQMMVDDDLPLACVFEDDVQFHHHWRELAPTYFGFTPRDYDILYLGSQIEVPGAGLVRRVPVYCTHAYLITNAGARKLRSLVLDDPKGVATIDCMLIEHQWHELNGRGPSPYEWYVWDGSTFGDARAIHHAGWQKRNTGLVFQDFDLGSDVETFGLHPGPPHASGGAFVAGQARSYDEEFYASKRSQVTATARAIAPYLLDLVKPASVVDIGCGTGEWLAAFRQLGVTDVLGVDGEWVPRQALHIPPEQFIGHDLREPLDLERAFDLALSLETAEHLPPDRAEVFVASLAKLAPVVVFSAAIPFQPGTDHLNLQWPGYWAALFAGHGLVAVDCLRARIWESPDVPYWYAQNTILYVNNAAAEQHEHLGKLRAMSTGFPLPLVHPALYRWLCGLLQQRA
jgi:GR25 family glycosyltransferase involved in LPS biosynthesis